MIQLISKNSLITSLIFLLGACGGGGGNSAANAPFNSGTGFNGTVWSLAAATDGSGDIYVGGNFTDYNGNARSMIARINADGSLDTAFNPGTGFNGTVRSLATATGSSGDIYVGGGFTNYNGTTINRIARINSDGTLDTGFDPGGGFNADVIAITPATDASGVIFVGGNFTDYDGNARSRIARIHPDGSVDTGFDPGSGFDDVVSSISLATDVSGDIYAGGNFTTYRGDARRGAVRIDSDGANDAAFNPGAGFSLLAPAIGTGVGVVVAVNDGSGDILVAGFFANFNGSSSNNIVRLDNTGSLAGGFDSGSGSDLGFVDIAFAPDGSGDIYAVGNFSSYRGNPRSGITRISSDGSNDGDFNPGTGVDGSAIWDILVTGSGLYLGGPFTTYQGAAANRIVRIDTTGAPN